LEQIFEVELGGSICVVFGRTNSLQ